MRRWLAVAAVLLSLSCAERRYSERLLPGSLYLEVSDSVGSPVVLLRGGKEVFYGRVREFYRTSYYAPNRYGKIDVFLPTGYGCARAEVELSSSGCGVAIVPDTPTTVGSCPSCDSMETRRNTVIDVLTWDRPVAVKMGDRCLPVYETGRVYALYIDSLVPGEYLLVVGSDTDTVFVSSEECTEIRRVK